MRMFNQEAILDKAFRAQVIEDIKSSSNDRRKREAEKRQDCFRDNTIKWVLKYLEDLKLKPQTLAIMQKHASNISLQKKIVNKKAKAYRGSVMRSAGDPETTAQVMSMAAIMGVNDQFKKADAQTVLHKNSLLMLLPDPTPEGKVCLRPSVLGPWQYDVIEDARNPERPACIILSEYNDDEGTQSYNSAQLQAIDASTSEIGNQTISQGTHVSQFNKKQYFIWWTDLYHFTTDETGEIMNHVSPEGLTNPIGMMPAVPISQDQDGKYWGSGGDDVTDGSILVNLMATDMNAIMYMQGWGQLVISGPNIPATFEVGPHTALVLETREGQTAASVELLAHSPPIDSWLKVIEQYVAMLLTTNDLSTGSVAIKLDAGSFPSGIAMLIDKSEVIGSIDDRRQAFATAERRFWKIAAAWTQLYGQAQQLDYEFDEIGPLPADIEVSVRYQGEEQITTEKEKLDILEQRKKLGLASQIDLIKADNPNMTDDEAKAKLAEIKSLAETVVKDATNTVDSMIQAKTKDQGSNDGTNPETDQTASTDT